MRPADGAQFASSPVCLAALHEALDAAAQAALAAEDGDLARAGLALLGADMAGAAAFPVESREARALAVVLSAIAAPVPAGRPEARGGAR
jgi:hypothetical protein